VISDFANMLESSLFSDAGFAFEKEEKLNNSPEEENIFLSEKAPRFLDGLQKVLGDKNYFATNEKVKINFFLKSYAIFVKIWK